MYALLCSNNKIHIPAFHIDLWLINVWIKINFAKLNMVRLPQNKKQTHWLNSKPQIGPSELTLAMTLTLNFQVQIWNLLYLSQRWFDCHKMKSMHKEWTEALNDHQVWTWPWPWKVRCKDLSDNDQGDFRYRCAVDSSSLISNLFEFNSYLYNLVASWTVMLFSI